MNENFARVDERKGVSAISVPNFLYPLVYMHLSCFLLKTH